MPPNASNRWSTMSTTRQSQAWLVCPSVAARLAHASPLLLHLVLVCFSTYSGVSTNQSLSLSTLPVPGSHHNSPPIMLKLLGGTPMNCTECDILSKVQPTLTASSQATQLHTPHYQNESRPSRETPFVLLNRRSKTTSFYPDYLRNARSAVIETTIAPTLSMAASQDSDSASSTMTTSSPVSTSRPLTGFGDFFVPESPSENADDDEDFQTGDKNNADQMNAKSNVAFTSSVSSDISDIGAAFGDIENQEVGQIDQEVEDTSDQFASGHFGDNETPQVSQRERILVIGNPRMLPPYPAEGIFTMQQAIPDNFEGCYCDRHYRVTQSANSEDSVNPTSLEQHHPSESNQSAPNLSQSSGTITMGTPSQEEVFCYCVGESVIQVPKNFSLNVRKIVLKRIGLEVLRTDAFQHYVNLTEIYMSNMHNLHRIEGGAFSHLPNLMTIYIKMAPALKHIPDGVFLGSIPKLMHLKVIHSGLEQIPMIYQSKSNRIISMIDFDNSRIRNLTTRSVNVRAESLNIEYNNIEFVANHAFFDSQIAKLSLKGNKNLVFLEELAFSGLLYLRELDLSETSITKLPTMGLTDSLEVLRIMDTFTMKEIPFIYLFNRMKEAHLTYPYHCCAFRFPANHNPDEYAKIKRLFNTDRYCKDRAVIRTDKSTRSRRNISNSVNFTWLVEYITDMIKSNLNWPTSQSHRIKRHQEAFGFFLHPNSSMDYNETNVFGVIVNQSTINSDNLSPYQVIESSLNREDQDSSDQVESITDGFLPNFGKGPDIVLPGVFGTPHTSISPKQEFCGDISSQLPTVRCFPTPDAFNPCEDVMGNNFLRSLVWIVVVAAVVGNLAVIIVLVSGRFSFNVSKFLMINLAIADLMMGVYLLIIAVVDIRTMGVYFNYAIDWQHGNGCKITGFITVFASTLSIFTLTVITLERWFAITYAIQLNRRLKLGLAVKVMLFGWLYAILMAALPLFGVSSYSKTSICLPMEHRDFLDNLYLISLLSINGFAFILITACYGKMYISIISQQTRATMNDMTIAKRMALLVFTDFACWAPIAFFGLTAISGFPLIDVPQSKFLLVTFYPLNSCANPFLYAILTKQYRRDFFILVSRYGLCTKQAMRYKNATRHHVNYYLKHHHHHHRGNSQHDSSDTAPRAKHLIKPNPGSIFSQMSCDGQNVHLYKYICKGHHHHHYCAAYHQSHQSQTPSLNNPSSMASQNQHSHHSCSEAEQSSEHDEQLDQACCSKYGSQECIDSKSDSVASLTGDKNKHRKHKRCHNMHHHHHHRLRCHCQRRHHCNGYNRCHRKCTTAAGNSHKNDHSASCCHSAVFSTVNIYPELSSDKKDRHRHHDCEQCSCRAENSSNENEQGASSKSSKRLTNHEERESHSREKGSSSAEQVHIMRNNTKVDAVNCGSLNGRVMYTRHKSTANCGDLRNSTCSKMANAKFKHKRSLPFVSLIEKISFAKMLRSKAKHKNGTRPCPPDLECSETSSPYSSSTSSCRRHCHHHQRCCHSHQQHLSVPNHVANESESSQSNRLPMEEQREILRQALQESTTVQEAVAVVEELSSGTRVSMGSSSSSKKTLKVGSEHKDNC